MQNFRVDDLEQLLKKLSDQGVTIIGDLQSYEYGKFGWILDIEGNKSKLGQLVDTVLQ